MKKNTIEIEISGNKVSIDYDSLFVNFANKPSREAFTIVNKYLADEGFLDADFIEGMTIDKK